MMLSLAVSGAVATAAAAAYGAFHRNSPIFGHVLGRLPTREKVVALTFDDGPNPDATPRILDVLSAQRVHATFFLLGRHVERYPELARRVAADGHTLGNHGFHHRKLHLCGPAYTRRDLEMGRAAIVGATGQRPAFFRAPHGFRSPWVTSIAKSLGQRTVGWTLGVWDSDRPGSDEITKRVLQGCSPGAIVLLHDGDAYDERGDRSQTADALAAIIRRLRERDYEFASLPR